METGWTEIERDAKEIRETLTELLLKHSKIQPPRYEEVQFFSPDGDRSFAPIDEAGREIQAALSKRYAGFSSALKAMFQGGPEDVVAKAEKNDEIVVRTIEQRITWCETTQKALDRALEALDNQLKMAKAVSDEKGRSA